MKAGTEEYKQMVHGNMILRHLTSVHRPIHGLDIILDEKDVLVQEYTDKIHVLLHTLEVLMENQSSEQKASE